MSVLVYVNNISSLTEVNNIEYLQSLFKKLYKKLYYEDYTNIKEKYALLVLIVVAIITEPINCK